MLEPEHDFVVIRESRQRFFLGLQLLDSFLKVRTISIRQMLCAHLAKLSCRQVSRRRPAHQGLAPCEMLTLNLRVLRGSGRGISMVNMKHRIGGPGYSF